MLSFVYRFIFSTETFLCKKKSRFNEHLHIIDKQTEKHFFSTQTEKHFISTHKEDYFGAMTFYKNTGKLCYCWEEAVMWC